MCAEPVRHVSDRPRPAPPPSTSPLARAGLVLMGIVALSLVVAFVGFCGFGGLRRPPADNGVQNPIVQAKADAEEQRRARADAEEQHRARVKVVTAAKLLQEFEDNPDADQKYKGQYLEISGVVERSGKDGNNTPFIVLHAGDEDAKLKIECFFDSADQMEAGWIKLLRKGRTVTVRGEYGGRVSHLQIRECVLVR